MPRERLQSCRDCRDCGPWSTIKNTIAQKLCTAGHRCQRIKLNIKGFDRSLLRDGLHEAAPKKSETASLPQMKIGLIAIRLDGK